MSASLEIGPAGVPNTHEQSAATAADFLYPGSGVPLDSEIEKAQSLDLAAVLVLKEELKDLVGDENDPYDRNQLLKELAEQYRADLDIDVANLSPADRSEIVISRMFLSNVEALCSLREFLRAKYWAPSDYEGVESKLHYLDGRKEYQADVDQFYRFYAGIIPEALDERVMETANMARLLVTNRDWVGALSIEHNHIFLGGILSERAVKHSLSGHGFPDARYGTSEEDASPINADVVVPRAGQDIHLQVKMRWARPMEMVILEDRRPIHVVLPMMVVRGALTRPEHRQLIRAVTRAADELESDTLLTDENELELQAA